MIPIYIQIPRPSFENDGVWLYGFGLNLHIIQTRNQKKRLMHRQARLEHFDRALPDVDHTAFVASNLNEVEHQLQKYNVYYRKFDSEKLGVSQIFLFDPGEYLSI